MLPAPRPALSRRYFCTLAAACASLGVLPSTRLLASSGPVTALSADEALQRLQEGNARYLREPDLCQAEIDAMRQSTGAHQAPWASIVSCADSRVPPELIFGGLGIGELFVCRNAGNLVDGAVIGTLEYGATALGIPLIVVLGHERCGAVGAAKELADGHAHFPPGITALVRQILPAVESTRELAGDPLDNAVKENARRNARRVTESSATLAALVESGQLRIVSARYDLDEGRVEFLG